MHNPDDLTPPHWGEEYPRPYDKFKDEPFIGPVTRRGAVLLAFGAAVVAIWGGLLYLLLA